LRVPLVIAAHREYAAFGTRGSGIPEDSQALISDNLRNRLKHHLFQPPSKGKFPVSAEAIRI
jgi:hypothetical protein